jgi:hypothetical protein
MNKNNSHHMDDITNLITYDNGMVVPSSIHNNENVKLNQLTQWITKKLHPSQTAEEAFKHLVMAYNTTAWKVPAATLLGLIFLYLNRSKIENHFWEGLSKYRKWAAAKHHEKSDLFHDMKTIQELAASQKSKYTVQKKMKETSLVEPPLVDDSLSIIVKMIDAKGQPVAIMANDKDEVPEQLYEIWQIIGDTIAQHVDEINPIIIPQSKGAVSFIVMDTKNQTLTTKELIRELKQKHFISTDKFVTFETSLVDGKIHPELLISIIYENK